MATPLLNHIADCRERRRLSSAGQAKALVFRLTSSSLPLYLLFLINDQPALLTNGRHLPCPSTAGQMCHVTVIGTQKDTQLL